MSPLAPTLEAFFTERLIGQRQASPHTIASYRDSFRLLLGFASQHTGTFPSRLDLADLDPSLISAFLDHMERERGASVRTRNARLAAIRSLFRFAALRHPEHAALIQRVLAIPQKRFDRNEVSFLTRDETEALLAAPNRSAWIGRRDHALLALAAQTGLRVSELISLRRRDLELGACARVTCRGKGRKARSTPLTRQTVKIIRAWLDELPSRPDTPLFPGPAGHAIEPRRHPAAGDPALADRSTTLPLAPGKARHPAHTASFLRHVIASGRDRPIHHRAVARPRADRDRPDLSPRRPRPQGTRPRADQHTSNRGNHALPRTGLPARIPGKPLIMRRLHPPRPPPPARTARRPRSRRIISHAA